MITIKIKPWSGIGPLTHIATDYQVASDSNFTNILDDHVNDAVNLTVFYSQVVIPSNTTYYVRVRRHLKDISTNVTTVSIWGDTIAVANTSNGNGMLSYTPVKVFQPVVTVDTVALNDPLSNTFTVSTSAFVGHNEGHGETLWAVLNDKNEVLLHNVSNINLTSIVFTKLNNMLLNTKYLKIIAIHRTHTNIESPVGSVIVDISNVNFSIIVNNTIHAAGIDLPISIVRQSGLPNNELSRIALIDINGTEIWTLPISPGTNSAIIPGLLFDAEMQYIVTAYGVPSNANHSYSIGITTRSDITGNTIDISRVYNKTVTLLPGGIFPISGNLDTEEVYGGRILVPNSNSLKNVTRNHDNTYTIQSILSGPTYTNAQQAYVHVTVLSKDRLFIDTIDGNGLSSTILWNVDYYNNSATLMNSSTDTGSTLSMNNGIVVMGDILYVARDMYTVLRKYDVSVDTLNRTDIALPNGITNVRLVTKDMGNNLLVFCQGSPEIFSYNIRTNVYSPKYTLPITFQDRTLKQQRLANGDVIVWKPYISEIVNGVTITDADLDLLYIDNTTGIMTHTVPYTGLTSNVEGTILMNDGSVFMCINDNAGTVLVFE